MIAVIGIILLTIGISISARIEEKFYEAFSGDWLRFDEEPTERERLEMENDEFNWGHNVKHRTEEDYE